MHAGLIHPSSYGPNYTFQVASAPRRGFPGLGAHTHPARQAMDQYASCLRAGAATAPHRPLARSTNGWHRRGRAPQPPNAARRAVTAAMSTHPARAVTRTMCARARRSCSPPLASIGAATYCADFLFLSSSPALFPSGLFVKTVYLHHLILISFFFFGPQGS